MENYCDVDVKFGFGLNITMSIILLLSGIALICLGFSRDFLDKMIKKTTWKCPQCGNENEDDFCTQCGAARIKDL